MGIALSALGLLLASVACGLSVAVALRVKKLLDPLTEEGALSGRRVAGPAPGTLVPLPGALVDMDGADVAWPADGSGPWVLTFQAVGCTGCKQQLPAYKKFLQKMALDRGRVVAVVVGDHEGASFYREELGAYAHVVHGADNALRLVEELGVSMFPTYLVVDGNGRVLASPQSSARLAETGAGLLTPTAVSA
ncbi:TlpA family protein disulfide reductase [Streptomyces sp. NPDC091281]|uniref:TlpA family protein disulfide reductase n=1 Tax=Streptomyces sp. NPDC091281 TaxID=3365985 RepID=UPI0038233F04